MIGANLRTAEQSGAVEELINLPLRGDNPHIQNWKETGGKVFGYVCSYVPEEMLCAAEGSSKILPIRMGAQACKSTEDADLYMHRFMCSFTRSLLQLGLTGEYDFVDGVVFTNCCEHMRRNYEQWRDHVKPPFISMVSIPHSMKAESHFGWYCDELHNLSRDVEKKYGCRVSRDTLQKSIKAYNRYRMLMLEMYDLRAIKYPKLSGSEAIKIAQAAFNMPKEAFNERMETALEELRRRPGIKDYRARIMVSGSYIDDSSLFDIIESTGAIVVTDSLCTGRKYIDGLVDENAEPLEALARRYFYKVSCPRMVEGYGDRVAFTKKVAQEANVDGVIFERIPFCDSHAVENMMESNELEGIGIPTLSLEREYFTADKGRLKTRVQAFMEKLGR